MAGRIARPLAVVVLIAAIAAALFISKRTSRREHPAPGGTPAAATDAPARGGELVASFRGEPRTYNRYIDSQAAADLLALLTQAPLITVDRTTDTLQPWLAESWTVSPDLLTYTLKLRQGVTFSDGAPFTSADVLFSFRALYDPKVNATLAPDTFVQGKPLQVEAPDASTVILRLPAPFAAGLRLLDGIPMLPRHKLEPALLGGTFPEAWSTAQLADVVSLGPFVLSEHVSGQRLVFMRNPRFWRTDAAGVQLPYLDKLTVLIIPDQNAEAVRMQSGEVDLMSNADIRPDDHAAFKRMADQGRLRLLDVGIGLDPNALWFNLSPARANDPRAAWMRQKAFRQGLSCAIDRDAIVKSAYLGEAVSIYGPVTPGNKTWFTDVRPACQHDPAQARALFQSAGLSDRDGDGMLEDSHGTPARFSILTQRDNIRARVVAVIQEQLRKTGLTVDLVQLDPGGIGERWMKGDYDAIYFATQASGTDPTTTPGFWLSSGDFHFWNPRQKQPATEWERRIDGLMHQMSVTGDVTERQRIFGDVQRLFVDELPALYFVAPKITIAISSRVVNPRPALQIPQLLWSADTLAARPAIR